MRTTVFLVIPALVLAGLVHAAEPLFGPVIQNHGPVYPVPEGSYNLNAGQSYKVIMDIGKGPDDPARLNRGIESAARFLNMHARNGIQLGNLEMAVVLHGAGARAALSDPAYEKHFGAANPNRSMLGELGQAGVRIYLCGQTAAYYGYEPGDLLPQVTMAVSAMTVHVGLQQEGYRAILF